MANYVADNLVKVICQLNNLISYLLASVYLLLWTFLVMTAIVYLWNTHVVALNCWLGILNPCNCMFCLKLSNIANYCSQTLLSTIWKFCQRRLERLWTPLSPTFHSKLFAVERKSDVVKASANDHEGRPVKVKRYICYSTPITKLSCIHS